MLENAKTRVTLGGKIMPNISKFTVMYNVEDDFPKGIIELLDGSKLDVQVLDIELVKENNFDNSKDTICWTQYMCQLWKF